MEINNQKLISFKVVNFKKVKEIEITIQDDITIIQGENRQGKTSTIDALEVALGGTKALKSTDTITPIRNGSDEALIDVELTDFIVEKRFNNKGSVLYVKTKNGAAFKSPQAMLDSFLGSFIDPSEFYKMKSEEQYKILIDMVGLEKQLKDLAEERELKYSERTAINKDKVRLQKTLESMPSPKSNLPDKELDPAEVHLKLKEANKIISNNEMAKVELQHARNAFQRTKVELENIDANILEYEEKIKNLKLKRESVVKEREEVKQKGKELEKKVNNLFEPNVEIYEAELNELEDINRAIRHATNYSQIQNQIGDLVIESDLCTEDLRLIDEKKYRLLQETKFPVEGLSFNDNYVTYNGIPFNQCSSEERLTIASIIAMTETPNKPKKLKLLLIRDGSPFDEKHFDWLMALAKEYGYQVLVERPGLAVKEAYLIENGELKNENKT